VYALVQGCLVALIVVPIILKSVVKLKIGAPFGGSI
jgi:hypothetical protein